MISVLDAVVLAGLTLHLYLGGRVTIGLFGITLYGIYRLNKSAPRKKYIKIDNKLELVDAKDADKKSESFLAVDFTGSFMPTEPKQLRKKKAPVRVIKRAVAKKSGAQLIKTNNNFTASDIYIIYSSLTGASERNAKYLLNRLSSDKAIAKAPTLINLDDDVDDLDDYFVGVPSQKCLYVLVLPSYEIDSPIDFFLQTMEENSTDFRIDSFPLKDKLLGYSVIGIGDKEQYGGPKFCYQAAKADSLLNKLGGTRIFPLGKFCIKNDKDEKIQQWCDLYIDSLKDNETMVVEDNEQDDSSTLVDIEEMGNMMDKGEAQEAETKEMVAKDSPTYKSLTKQGYTIVGSHSGVKICRWTKSALRNRGSCYKYAFYGIRSHLCMETTPSLSCSNKCVFCWRHGTNPVGTNWRWQVDGPQEILNGALEGHYKKIKQMRGVPGINNERFQEAFTVRHCALSLVGEPIFYPYINEFVGMLHEKHISSFLVCNAQHPEQLKNLRKVTQLYVSIDAPTKDELKKVDRPLFKDFWDRLVSCLDILNTVQSKQRTVFRLTLVKGFNMGEVQGYADLIARANPSLIEIKGATFCGSSTGNGNPLTMQNIPFYEECKSFVTALNQELHSRNLPYDIAAEHAHSCCILMANLKYKVNGKWHTHIDYSRFFELLELRGEEFDESEYISQTPDWAYWGSDQAGFNPEDVRYNRKEEKLKKKLIREQGGSLELAGVENPGA